MSRDTRAQYRSNSRNRLRTGARGRQLLRLLRAGVELLWAPGATSARPAPRTATAPHGSGFSASIKGHLQQTIALALTKPRIAQLASRPCRSNTFFHQGHVPNGKTEPTFARHSSLVQAPKESQQKDTQRHPKCAAFPPLISWPPIPSTSNLFTSNLIPLYN